MQITSTSQCRSPNPLDTATRQMAASLITTYQKQLSPRKGFSCAFRALNDSESCSQYTKRVILEIGIGQAIPLIQQRFQACKAANQTLKAKRCQTKEPQAALRQPWMAMEDAPLDDEPIAPPDENADSSEKRQRGKGIGGGSFRKPPISSTTDASNTTNHNNCSNLSCDAVDCTSFGCDAIDCSSADCSSMDCGTADCNSLDCGSLDCGSCDFGSCDCSF